MCWVGVVLGAWAVVSTVFALALARSIRIADDKEGITPPP